MNATAEKLADQALALPIKERALLVRKLIASLDAESDPDAEARWMEEIDRRSREMEAGRIDTRPEEEVIGEIRAKLHATRRSTS